MGFLIERCRQGLVVILVISSLGCESSTQPSTETFPPVARFVSAGLAAAGGAIAGTSDGGIVAWSNSGVFNVSRFSRDGDQLWATSTGPCQQVECSLAVDASGDVYVPTTGYLYALNSTGSLRWRSQEITGGAIALGTSNRVFGTASRLPNSPAIVAVDKANGSAIWATSLSNFSPVLVLLDESRATVYATGGGGVVAINSLTGAERWRVSLLSCGRAALGVAGEIDVVCSSSSGLALYSVTAGGAIRWSRPLTGLTGAFMSPMIDASGIIIVTATSGINAFTNAGDLFWTYSVNTDGGLLALSDPVIDVDGNVYLVEKRTVASAPALTVFRDGQRIGEIANVSDPHGRSLLMARDGRVFYDAAGSIVYFESKGFDGASPWPMNRGSPGRTARRSLTISSAVSTGG